MEISLLKIAVTVYLRVRYGGDIGTFVPHGNPAVAMYDYLEARRRLDIQQPVAGDRGTTWAWYTWCMGLGILLAIITWPLGRFGITEGFLGLAVVGFVAAVCISVVETYRDVSGYREWSRQLESKAPFDVSNRR